MRMRKKPWSQNEIDSNERVVHDPESHKGQWAERFSNTNPIHLEIGCGKGNFLIQNAGLHPNINFIGLEAQREIAVIAARKAREAECSANVAFIIGNAKNANQYFASGEVGRIYLNFSDPWPKPRWAKRRLTYDSFLKVYEEIFGSRGELFLKTDNKILFDFSLKTLGNRAGWQVDNVSRDLHNSGFEGNVMTEYEQKFSSQGVPINRLEAYYNC